MFAVIEFTDESSIAVVSSQWLTDCQRFCKWPSTAGPNITKLVTRHANPEEDWNSFPCRVLKLLCKSD
jgi:hypothetical protein